MYEKKKLKKMFQIRKIQTFRAIKSVIMSDGVYFSRDCFRDKITENRNQTPNIRFEIDNKYEYFEQCTHDFVLLFSFGGANT